MNLQAEFFHFCWNVIGKGRSLAPKVSPNGYIFLKLCQLKDVRAGWSIEFRGHFHYA